MGKKSKIKNSAKYARKYSNHPIARALDRAKSVIAEAKEDGVVTPQEEARIKEAKKEVVDAVTESAKELVEAVAAPVVEAAEKVAEKAKKIADAASKSEPAKKKLSKRSSAKPKSEGRKKLS